jgi:hypothetical protein
MADAKTCDRCGEVIPLYQKLPDKEFKDGYWRYEVRKDCYPYPDIEIDLCLNCKKDLVENWLKGR